jgi:hypothetical protein
MFTAPRPSLWLGQVTEAGGRFTVALELAQLWLGKSLLGQSQCTVASVWIETSFRAICFGTMPVLYMYYSAGALVNEN